MQIYVKNDDLYFLMEPYQSIGFSEHYYAYNIQQHGKCIFKKADDLVDTHSAVPPPPQHAEEFLFFIISADAVVFFSV